MVRFSVIVPLYNKAPYVRHALESILTQSFTNYEVVIVDDGATDNSLAIVNDFVKTVESGKWKVESQPNAGVAAARNNGGAKSKGEYVCFLDADDWWEPMFLEEMDKLIREYPEAGLYAMNYVYYKPGKTHVALKIERGYINYPKAYLHSDAMPVWTGAASMPRKVFDEMGGFPVGIKLGEDFLLWAKTALHYQVAFSEKALAYYNNDVPTTLRATRNLYKPEYHMLFNLGEIESIVNSQESSVDSRDEWNALLDKLRVKGLLKYWMDATYHAAAEEELKKVNWSKQPKSIVRQYKTPIVVLKMKESIMRFGSYCKQRLKKMCK